ncbi:hypothetical protein FDG2_6441 [Candidatus Protofrankia californiensis]|uniref:DUF2470 domain-containing protein n=1 Tax=Candidatus Protofrankia californiensis TaxID=1839754 RepID=A0A1C3PGZ1_9ACTN|nr:hypothetical protein FDG2_6441 [Candidatus Protofrankia californiensis]
MLLATAGSPPAHAAGSYPTARVDIHGPQGERLVLSGSLRVVPAPTADVIARLVGPGCPAPRPPLGPSGHEQDLVAIAMVVAEVVPYMLTSTDPGTAATRTSTDRGDPRSAGLPGTPPEATTAPTTKGSRRTPQAGRGRDHVRTRTTESVGTRIDLVAYALAEPDLIAAYAPDLVTHLNTAHAEQIRRLAEYAVAVDPGQGDGTRRSPGPRPARIVLSTDHP